MRHTARGVPPHTCPHCGTLLVSHGPGASEVNGLSCPACERTFPCRGALLDLRLSGIEKPPTPLAPGDLEHFTAPRSKSDFRESFEALLAALPRRRADHVMHLSKPSRGAWLLLLEGAGGTVLFSGNPLSGTASALAQCGYEVWLVDANRERLELGLELLEHRSPGSGHAVLFDGERWPFSDDAFDLVILEEGFPGPASGHVEVLSECARIGRELCVVVDNRLGYKRSHGRRKSFVRARPVDYVRQILRRSGQRTLFGYRKLCRGRSEFNWRTLSLYPHRRDFTHVVEVDGTGPELPLGPLERANRVKVAARALGLFPLLTPSFALIGSPGKRKRDRGERLLAALAEELREPVPEIQQLSGTQGNTGLVLTRPAGAAGPVPERGGKGYWALHILLSARTAHGLSKHAKALDQLGAEFRDLPLPELLFEGQLEGLALTCERRLGGLRVYELTRAAAGCAISEASSILGTLVEREVCMDVPLYERLISPKLALQRRINPAPAVHKQLDSIERETRELLLGRTMPLVLQHGDLRPKHVQCSPTGAVLGFLDWGSWRRLELPYYDILHLVVHHIAQRHGVRDHEAWKRVLAGRGTTDVERKALEAAAAQLEPDVRRAIEILYPVLVADTASTHWDFDRPRWYERKFVVE